MAITDPRDISGLVFWYSPEYEDANYNDGDQITTLTDLSGNGNHATGATTSTAKPLWKATGGPTGGAERIRFENGGYFTIPNTIMSGATAGELMDMRKSDYLVTTTSQGSDKFGDHASTSDHYGYDGGVYDGFGSSGRKGPLTPPAALNVWHRHGKWSASGDWALQHDGTTYGATGSNTVAFKSIGNITIGNGGQTPSNTATDTFEGDRGAIVLYNKKLSDTERSDLATWMAANPSGGLPTAPIPEVTADLTGTGTMSATVSAVMEVAAALTGTGTMSATVDAGILTGPTPPIGDPPGLVPLTVRIGDRHITREVSGLQFRKEAVGGTKSIRLRLARTLDRFDANLAAFSEVTVYDGRSAEIVAQGKLNDTGRSASAGDGQQWDIVAFAPSLTDRTFPYVLFDTNQEAFTRSTYSTPNASTRADERDADTPSLILYVDEGKTASTAFVADMIHRGVREAGMKLARVRTDIDAGDTDIDWNLQLVTRAGAGSGTVVATTTASTTASMLYGEVVTEFANGHDVCSIRVTRSGSPQVAGDVTWFEFWDVTLESLRLNADGTEITTGYDGVLNAHDVVNDLLGRVLDQIDGANSEVDTGGTYQIDQLSYPDGVTAEQVMTDLMALEPAYRWRIEPTASGTYILHWEPWPTTVRYEVTLEGGGDFPASTKEVYNEVRVRWRGKNGRVRTTAPITMACPTLDDKGITRSYMLDLGDEVGSAAAATRAGENFLAEHNVPANAGTVTIDRPIRDLLTGRRVRPHQIEAGELIRVRGVESYPDALNASSNDGLTVFRIWSVTYGSDSDSAVCELDIPSRSTQNALVKLAKRRNRKR